MQGAATEEDLFIERLDRNFLLVQLTFRASTPSYGPDVGLFPAALKRVVEEHGVQELELSLARGRWEELPPNSTARQAGGLPPAGLILKVQFHPWVADTQPAFRGVVESLGGLLGVPVARVLEDGAVAAPLVGWFGQTAILRRQIYAASPGEVCCTLQLAAWSNLLPCRREAGLGALLEPSAHAAAPYSSVRLRLSAGATAGGGRAGSAAGGSACCTRCASLIQSELSVAVVLPSAQGVAGGGPSPRRDGREPAGGGAGLCAPDMAQRAEQLLRQVLGRPLPPPCQAAARSSIRVPASLLRAGGTAAAAHTASPPVASTAPTSRHAPRLECCAQARGEGGPAHSGWVTCSLRVLSRPATPRAGAAGCGTSSAARAAEAAQQAEHGGGAYPWGDGDSEAEVAGALQVVRHVVPRGLTAGNLVLSIRASDPDTPAAPPTASTACSMDAGQEGRGVGVHGVSRRKGGAAGGCAPAALLHVFQLVPWQLPMQLHALRLRVNGQEVGLAHPLVAWHRILPTEGPSVPGVLELLLRLSESKGGAPAAPSARHEISVSVGFEKRLLSVFQLPPDASRGVDIPAAQVNLVPGACALAPLPMPSTSAGAAGSAGGACSAGCNNDASKAGSSWQVYSGRGCAVQHAHTAVHLVPLPIPDLSMPFNVCCFTSTVLAVYFGGVLNSLLRPPTAEGPGSEAAQRGGLRAKLRRVLLLCLLGGSLALYLDKDLQHWADTYLQWLALGRESHPAGEL